MKMMKFLWDSKYSINIKSIDKQHQTFFEVINELYLDFEDGQGTPEQLEGILKRFTDYGEFHLGFEEKYFKELRYPQAKEHIKQHDYFRKQIKDYKAELKKPETKTEELANEMAEFAKNWLSEHILETDQKYSEFFLMHDVK